jgi:Na+-driven multidrug efflux pump
MSFAFLHDKDFFRAMLAIAAPVAFQQLITAGPNMMDVLMVGQLGETAVAALGLANQIFFLLFIRALRAVIHVTPCLPSCFPSG